MKSKDNLLVNSITVSFRKLISLCNRILFYCFQFFPLNPYLIIFESEGDFCDNSYALFEYLKDNHFLNKYKAVWLVDNVKVLSEKFPETTFIKRWPTTVDLKRSFYLGTCKFYIFTHNNVLEKYHNRKKRKIINLWHGCGFKRSKGRTNYKQNRYGSPYVFFLTGELFITSYKEAFGCSEDSIVEIGYPRNDYLFKQYNDNQKNFFDKRLAKYYKCILWMPTFRRTNNGNLDEDYFISDTGLPLIDSIDKLVKFNGYLKKNNSICVFKLHHLQSGLNAFNDAYSNIFVLKDEDLMRENIQLYQMISMFDCLITDYSSIATDYMLLNRPMIFTIDDYEDYDNSRGFSVENAIDYFPGHCVKTADEFYVALNAVIDGNDLFKNKRNELMYCFHKYPDGNTSKRIVEYIGLEH